MVCHCSSHPNDDSAFRCDIVTQNNRRGKEFICLVEFRLNEGLTWNPQAWSLETILTARCYAQRFHIL